MAKFLKVPSILLALAIGYVVPSAAFAKTNTESAERSKINLTSDKTRKTPLPQFSNDAKKMQIADKRDWKKKRRSKRKHWRKRSRSHRGHRRYRSRHRHYRHRDRVGPEDVFGFIGGILVNEAFRAKRRSDFQRCDDRYKTFRWSDGTYQPYGNGPREVCRYLR